MNRFVLLCGLLAAAGFSASEARAQQTVRCESQGGRYQSCGVDTRGGVRLSRQLSSQGCWQNDTWGYDRNRIWVTNGCRAEFTVGENHSSGSNSGAVAGVAIAALIGAAILANKDKDRDDDRYDQHYNPGYGGGYRPGYGGGYNPIAVIRCESRNNGLTNCAVPRNGPVEVYRQISGTPCRYGNTWGTQPGSIWVTNGCRAEFAVY
ncbi:DUF3011 domain-containing protein [Luteimonas sp. SX5]|uniref:DUF3011 domain-containing protein n=1 Tax=Luteimonas galliterrae TaxID=2940486 RepID=A0ABT0MG54_9GAMM|nr:DUF3011 domain-containing protein [Luteimonas galliterrae]MCL1633855.1 DUF3011 domain-containing protein [Luteimonas galliterrae]